MSKEKIRTAYETMENGFYLDRLVEPKPTAAFAKADPKHYRELNAFPAFMCPRAVRK